MAPRARQLVLERRGVRHGRFPVPPRAETPPEERQAAWDADRPVFLPGILAPGLSRQRARIRRTLALFEDLRADRRDLQGEVRRRLRGNADFFPSGATVDLGDPREIEKVWVDGMQGERFAARALYAKLSWISHDERDSSLRIRFSFGVEDLLDWQRETRRAPWAQRYAEAVFPECAAVAGCAPLVRTIEGLFGRKVRLSERIVYNNAPGGGAIFHHDCEPWQHGVAFGQLEGETAWLALPKRELARELGAWARTAAWKRRTRTLRAALKTLDASDDPAVARVLNETPALTARLVERGALYHLRAGDALLLPNHGWDDTCWHAVFALGRTPSLAHSYGIFAARRKPGEQP